VLPVMFSKSLTHKRSRCSFGVINMPCSTPGVSALPEIIRPTGSTIVAMCCPHHRRVFDASSRSGPNVDSIAAYY
jgi:hypothetical protein